MPLYPQNATSQGVCSNSLLFCCFHFRLTFESIKELGGASYSLIMFFQYHDLPKNIIFDHGLYMFFQYHDLPKNIIFDHGL